MPSFSTDQYAWKDVKVNLFGRIPIGIQEVKYKTTTDHAPVYGRGNKPIAIQTGNKTFEGQIILLQSELEALHAAIQTENPGSDITDIPSDIIVSYGEGNTAKTDRIVHAKFGEFEKGLNQEDKYAEITIPFMALDIQYNV